MEIRKVAERRWHHFLSEGLEHMNFRKKLRVSGMTRNFLSSCRVVIQVTNKFGPIWQHSLRHPHLRQFIRSAVAQQLDRVLKHPVRKREELVVGKLLHQLTQSIRMQTLCQSFLLHGKPDMQSHVPVLAFPSQPDPWLSMSNFTSH